MEPNLSWPMNIDLAPDANGQQQNMGQQNPSQYGVFMGAPGGPGGGGGGMM